MNNLPDCIPQSIYQPDELSEFDIIDSLDLFEVAHYKAQKISLDNKFCEICGAIEKLQRHHPDYKQPLLVTILCAQCHADQHPRDRKESI